MSSYDAAAAAAADSDTWRDVTGAWRSAPAVNSSARQPACLPAGLGAVPLPLARPRPNIAANSTLIHHEILF